MRALVSIIIPVYNIEEYLPRCLESVAKQTYHNLEIILVDDGSTDGSWSICQSFEKKDNRFKTIRQDNGGPYIARNTGLRVAHGDYILFVDGDDYIHVDTVRIMLESINQNCGYDMAMVDYKKTIRLDENVEEILENVTTELAQDELMNNMFIKSSEYNVALYHCLWNKLFRRELVDGIWFYGDPRFEDFEFCFRVFLKVKRVVWIHSILYFYVQRFDSIVHQSESWISFYQIRTSQLYRQFKFLTSSKESHYIHLLLQTLYRKMVFMKGQSWKTDSQKEIFDKCREYERQTRSDYWRCLRISLFEKIAILFLLHSPCLARMLMKWKR